MDSAQGNRNDAITLHAECLALDSDTAARAPAWHASLRLRFARTAERTRLASAQHSGPLRLQRLLFPPGDASQGLILHPPGGIVGGDALAIDVQLDAGAEILLSTPGATKWYRSGGRSAEQRVRLRVGTDATLEWLPQEAILFDGAEATQSLHIDLAPNARMIGWDIVQLGRTAAGDAWQSGRLRQTLSLDRAGHTVWHEHADFAADDAARHAPSGLAGYPLFATLWAASADLDASPQSALDTVRALIPAAGLHSAPASEQSALCAAATWLPAPANLLLVRALGHDAETLRQVFEQVWAALRPLATGRRAQRPRIWAT